MNIWQVFTDGASSPDGRGGWAYVVVEDDLELMRKHGSAFGVTHQRMEIRAVVEALLAVPKNVPVEVVGDSAYVIDCFRKHWHVNWESNGWRNSSRKSVANRDEWERLIGAWRAREAETTWTRIRGHAGNRWNELVDALAVESKTRAGANREADAWPSNEGAVTFPLFDSATGITAPARRRKPRRAWWRELAATEMAAHLLATPTIADRAWTDEPRLPGEARAAFIRRLLLEETKTVEAREGDAGGT